MAAREFFYCFAIRLMKFRRPWLPTHLSGTAVILVQSLKQTEALQSFAFSRNKCFKCSAFICRSFASILFKCVKRHMQRITLACPNRRISHCFRNTQSGDALTNFRLCQPVFQLLVISKRTDFLDIQVNRIKPFGRRRAIRAGKGRLAGKQGVQRVNTDKIQLFLRRIFHQVQQIGKVAYTPVALGTQAVQMHGQTIHPTTIGKQFGLVNRFRRNNQAYKATFSAGLGRQSVITASQLGQLNPKRIVVARI